MKKMVLGIVLILVIITTYSCKENGVGPEKSYEPGRRDYVWTVDTINTFNPILRLWGSSPTDIWAIANDNSNENIYHFNGKKWTTNEYYIPYSPYSIYGFANDNVFIGAASGNIYHFDGSDWKLTTTLKKDGQSKIALNYMWGKSPDDFFAFGGSPDEKSFLNNSVIAHFNNKEWTILNTDGLKGIIGKLYKNKNDQVIYLQAIKASETYDTTFIYKYDQGKYTKLYSAMWDKYWASISLINNEVYFILSDEIATRINDQFQTILRLGSTNFYEHIWGRNSKDIFLEMTDGLAHYDGNDIKYLFHFNRQPKTQIWEAALFDQEVFFLVSEGTTNLSLIYHGKLNKGG